MFLALAIILGAAAVVLALRGLWQQADARHIQSRMETVLSLTGPMDRGAVDQFVDRANGGLTALFRPITEPLSEMFPKEVRERARARLASAGMLKRIGEPEYLAIRCVTTIIGFGFGVLLYRYIAVKSPAQAPMALTLLIVIGVLLPDYYLQTIINHRQYTIKKMLPDTIDLLIASLEAGTGFDAAVSRVEEKFPGPVAEEFGRMLQEMRLGKNRATALKDLAHRVAVPEVSTFVSAVVQADQLGASMTKVLRVQSQTIRQTRLLQVKEAAQKLPVKMLFPLVFFIFPAVFVVIAGPGVIRICEVLLK
jgi:tight adherence protein C